MSKHDQLYYLVSSFSLVGVRKQVGAARRALTSGAARARSCSSSRARPSLLRAQRHALAGGGGAGGAGGAQRGVLTLIKSNVCRIVLSSMETPFQDLQDRGQCINLASKWVGCGGLLAAAPHRLGVTRRCRGFLAVRRRRGAGQAARDLQAGGGGVQGGSVGGRGGGGGEGGLGCSLIESIV